MQIGDVLTYQGRPVVLLGIDPMSVPERRATVRVLDTDEELDVAYDELADREGLPPTG
jgi:hypothetical protein